MSSKSARQSQIAGDHYLEADIQPADYALSHDFNYHESFALKYLTRHRLKNGREDLEKAIHSLQMLIEHEYPSDG